MLKVNTKPIGRPKADTPKSIQYSVRLDAETEKKLQAYCEEKKISKGEAFRQGVKLLIGETKK